MFYRLYVFQTGNCKLLGITSLGTCILHLNLPTLTSMLEKMVNDISDQLPVQHVVDLIHVKEDHSPTHGDSPLTT